MDWILKLTPEQISAFGAAAWKLLGIGTMCAAVLLFRAQIGRALDRLIKLKIKRGETELSAETPQPALPEPRREPAGEARADPPTERTPGPSTVGTAVEGELDLGTQMLRAIMDRDLAKAEDKFRLIQNSETDAGERDRNEVRYWAFRYQFAGDVAGLERLRSLAHKESIRAEALASLGRCYQSAKDSRSAAKAFEEALSAIPESEEKRRAQVTRELLVCFTEIGEKAHALDMAIAALDHLATPEGRSIIFESIAQIEKSLGRKDLSAIALEKAGELQPGVTDKLFAAAYAQSETELHAIAASNYATLLKFDPQNATAENNLGVESDQLGMPIRATSAFRKSAELGGTLAMANLAYRFLDQGFVSEAEAMIRDAKKTSTYHENVARAEAALATQREAEREKWEGLKHWVDRQRDFLRRFADAYYQRSTQGVIPEGEWATSDGETLNFTVEPDRIVIEWSDGGTRRNLLCTLHNSAVRFEAQRWESSVLFSKGNGGGYWKSSGSGYGYFESREELRAMLLERDEPRYFLFVKDKTQEASQLGLAPAGAIVPQVK